MGKPNPNDRIDTTVPTIKKPLSVFQLEALRDENGNAKVYIWIPVNLLRSVFFPETDDLSKFKDEVCKYVSEKVTGDETAFTPDISNWTVIQYDSISFPERVKILFRFKVKNYLDRIVKHL